MFKYREISRKYDVEIHKRVGYLNLKNWNSLLIFRHHIRHKINNATRIAKFVVVPGN